MNGRTISRFIRFSACALSALVLPSLALADETFDLQIFKRAPGMPVGRVKLTLELASPPTNGVTKITIGATEVTLPATGTNIGTPSGDFVTFGRGTGNSVVIDYTPSSNFEVPSNLCDLRTTAPPSDGSKTVSIAFTGPTISAYRLNAYTAASNFSCGQAIKRVKSAAAPNPNAATVDLGVTNKGRHTLDLLLVLDRSGSMNSPAPGKPPGSLSKWTILKDSIESLVNRWDVLEAPLFPDGDWSGDRISVVLFGSAAANALGGSPFRDRADWDEVVSSLPLAPGGSTGMGSGINLALMNYNPLPLPKNDAVMVIMTDGMQNIPPPPVTPDAKGAEKKLAPTAGDPTEIPLHTRGIPMHTVAFGTPATVQADLLDDIAQQTSGLLRETADAFGTSDAFIDHLVGALKGNTISLAHRQRATLSGNSGPLIPIVVDQSVQRAVFSVEWPAPSRLLDVQVFPPGMTVSPTSIGETPTARRDADHSTVVGFDMKPNWVGTWQVRVVQRTIGTAAIPQDIPYNLSAHFLENRLSYTIRFEDIHQGTGDHMDLRAEVAYDGLPLTGLPPNALTVRIHRPGEAIGTILHDTKVEGAVLTTEINPADLTNPYQRKIEFLTGSGSLNDRVAPRPVSTITLQHTTDGIYTGSFSDTSVPGLYHFDLVLDWEDPRTGHVRRAEVLERELKVNPDLEMTEIQTVAVGDQAFNVIVTPRDRFGNYLGPGWGSVVKAALRSAGRMVDGLPKDRDQTGTYVFTVMDVPPGETPRVDIVVDNVPVGSTESSTSKWRAFLDLGPNFPHGDFGNFIDGRLSINAGLERFVATSTSLEGILGYHAFDSDFGANPKIWQLSLNAKQYFGQGPLHYFVNGGIGAYRFDPGSTTRAGANVGLGVLYDLSPKLGVEGVYNFHAINTSGSQTELSTVQVGIRCSLF